LYLYSIKIQTDIDQNAGKTLQKITNVFEILFEELFLFFFGWAHPTHLAGLDPASLVGSLTQASDPTSF